jgi:signal transduction histidine kinase
MLIVIAVVFVTTRQSRSNWQLLGVSALIGAYAIAVMSVGHLGLAQSVGVLLVGGPAQVLVIWLTWRLIETLEASTKHETGHARIQKALSTCSQALLSGSGEKPLEKALAALLDATDADYVYVDLNKVDVDGHVTWAIVADATGDNVPDGDSDFYQGDFTQLDSIPELMKSGRPARVRVADLQMPLRAKYEADDIVSELMAPILVKGKWVGTIGYTDFWRDDAWTEIEVDALMRAADMVASYWERESAREGLEELSIAKDRFIATVSHELRTPLAAVMGFAEELADRLDSYTPAETVEMVKLISEQSKEVAELVDDLLTAERAASGNLTVKPTVIDLLDETRSVLGSIRGDRSVEIDGETTTAWADTLRIRQIVRNLVTNAFRYGGDVIRVEISGTDRESGLTVLDNGKGVLGIDAEHIFDAYYRLQSPESKLDSVGLGLAVARQLARLMDGDLVYKRRGGWTRFELTVPAAVERAPATA